MLAGGCSLGMPGWKPQFQMDAGALHSLCWGSLRWHSAERAQSLQLELRSLAGTELDTIQGRVPYEEPGDGMRRWGWASRGQQSPEQGRE